MEAKQCAPVDRVGNKIYFSQLKKAPVFNKRSIRTSDNPTSNHPYCPFNLFSRITKNDSFVIFTVTRKRKRRTRSVRRNGIETGGRTGTGAEMKENAPPVRRRRVKTRSEIGTASPTARREM